MYLKEDGIEGRLQRETAGGFLPCRCYCWNISLLIFSFAPPHSFPHPRCTIAADAALTAPFICRMQIECTRCCGARHSVLRGGGESSGLQAKQRETVIQAQLHVCIRSIAVLSPTGKKKNLEASHTRHTTHRRVNFSSDANSKRIRDRHTFACCSTIVHDFSSVMKILIYYRLKKRSIC